MHVRDLHKFFVRYSFYPLLLASALACLMVIARLRFDPSPAYAHMIWNLFLAWIPYSCSLWLRWIDKPTLRWWWLIVPGAIWLLFLPNAPYMLTEFVHLLHVPSNVLWYDIGMIATFAWIGCVLAVVSLSIVHRAVTARLGLVTGWFVVLISAGLSGFGVYLGRFLRWNSWDVVRDPHGLITDLAARLLDPFSHPRTYGVTAMWATLLIICYLTVISVRGSLPSRHDLPNS